MAISFIPNQPILFEDPLFAGQACLNNDNRAYAQLAQSGDSTCIQFINEPISSINNCNLNTNADEVINGGFDTDLSSWTEFNFATGLPTGTNYWTWSSQGATSDPGRTNVGLYQTLPGTPGDNYLISFEFDYDNGGDFKIVLGNHSTNSWNYVNLFNNFEINIDGRRCLLLSSYAGLDIGFWCSSSNVKIKNIVVRNISSCQLVTPNNSLNHWTYVESVNGWEKLDGTPAVAWPLELRASLVTGTSYRLTYKVMNMTEDKIAYFEIQDIDTNTIAKTYANGEFVEYFTYTGTTGFPNLLGDPNALHGVVYDILFEVMSYDFKIRISNEDGSCASIDYDSSSLDFPMVYWKDRAIWCFDWNTIETCDVPGNLTSGCYKVTVTDNYTSTDYLSYTNINYTTGTHACSLVVRASCNGTGFGFYFNDLDITSPSFTLIQRLRVLQFNPTYPMKTEQYLFSDGMMNRTYAQTGKLRSAWFDYCDEATHDIIRIQLLCDTLIIDNNYFFCIAEDYEPEWGQNGRYNLAQSRVVLMAQNEPTLFNKNCQ